MLGIQGHLAKSSDGVMRWYSLGVNYYYTGVLEGVKLHEDLPVHILPCM